MAGHSIDNEKINVRIELPDVLKFPDWQAYFKRQRELVDQDNITYLFLPALPLIEGGEYTVGGKTYDIKNAGEDVPASVARWVGKTVLDWVNAQLETEKNLSAPPSSVPTAAKTKTADK